MFLVVNTRCDRLNCWGKGNEIVILLARQLPSPWRDRIFPVFFCSPCDHAIFRQPITEKWDTRMTVSLSRQEQIRINQNARISPRVWFSKTLARLRILRDGGGCGCGWGEGRCAPPMRNRLSDRSHTNGIMRQWQVWHGTPAKSLHVRDFTRFCARATAPARADRLSKVSEFDGRAIN